MYDRNYYKAQVMLRDPWFVEKADWLRNRFAKVGCPLPEKPFKKYQEYLDWNTKFWDRYSEMERSPEFLAEKQKITGGKEKIPLEEYRALEEFREQFLPPIYGQTFSEILEHFKIDRNDEGFKSFLELYFFFGQTEYPTRLFNIIWKRNEKTDEFELFIRIYGHTKKEDIMDHWEWIAREQKIMKDFIGKSKAWKAFDRDIEIYNCYKKLKESGLIRRSNKAAFYGITALDKDTWTVLHKKYHKLTIGDVRRIVSRTAKRLGEI